MGVLMLLHAFDLNGERDWCTYCVPQYGSHRLSSFYSASELLRLCALLKPSAQVPQLVSSLTQPEVLVSFLGSNTCPQLAHILRLPFQSSHSFHTYSLHHSFTLSSSRPYFICYNLHPWLSLFILTLTKSTCGLATCRFLYLSVLWVFSPVPLFLFTTYNLVVNSCFDTFNNFVSASCFFRFSFILTFFFFQVSFIIYELILRLVDQKNVLSRKTD